MTPTFSILFYIRKDKSIDDETTAPIYCRITINGKRAEFSTKRNVPISKWKPGSESVTGTNEFAKATNHYLSQVKSQLHEFYARLQRDEKVITAPILKKVYFGLDKVDYGLFKLFEDHNYQIKELIGQKYAAGTHQRYQTTFEHIKKYIAFKYHRTEFNVREIDYDFITGLDHYLRVKHHCSNNTALKYIKNFRKLVILAKSKGLITSDPFNNFKTKLEPVERGYLTEEELNSIAGKVITNTRIDQIRDIFLFQCYTGLAYIDIKQLKRSQIIKDEEGKQWIRTHREKTNTLVKVPIFPVAFRIIEKYQNHPECEEGGLVLPVKSNQKMNVYLKELGGICDIEKNMSSHLARHTFATTVTLKNGISLEVVSTMLGHKKLSTTKIYAKMLDERVGNEMGKIADKFK
ncbi:MAG: site-specific integrase [Bacteroidota bacterium]|nr:site-specific integrase [Bacteroidota bacterium]